MQKTVLPWYRHRWPWLLMLGPALVAIACMVTIKLAFQQADQVVVSKEAVHGLVVNIDHRSAPKAPQEKDRQRP
jgi:uncharacterized protein